MTIKDRPPPISKKCQILGPPDKIVRERNGGFGGVTPIKLEKEEKVSGGFGVKKIH